MRAALYLALSAVMWGVNFHLLKAILTTVHFMEAGFWRYLFGVGVLAFFLIKPGVKWSDFKQNTSGILIVGFLGLFCFNVLLFIGMLHTSAMNAALIMSLNPLVTLLLANIFFGTRINYQQMAGAGLGISGVIYLIFQGNFNDFLNVAFAGGDLFVLLAMFLSAFYHVWVKKYATTLSNIHFTFFTNLICLASFTLILPFFVSRLPLNYGFNFWAAAIAFGSLGTALTYILWNKGVGMIGAQNAGIFMNIVPISTALIGIVMGIELTKFHVVAGVLITVGLLIPQLKIPKEALRWSHFRNK